MRRIICLAIIAMLLSPAFAAEATVYGFDDLVAAMERGNADLLKSDQEIAKAKLDTADAKGGYGPTIDLMVTGTFMANPTLGPMKVSPNDIKGLPDVIGSVWTDPIHVSMDMANNMVQGQLTLTQPIYTWGKLSNAVKLYQTVEGLRGMERSDKESQLIAELRSRLDALYHIESIMPLLDEIEGKADALLSIAEEAEGEGLMLAEDAASARIEKQQVSLTRRELENRRSSVLDGLRTLTGLDDLTWEMIDYEPDGDLIDSFLSLGEEAITAMAVDPQRLPLQMLEGMMTVQEYTNRIAKGSIYGKPDIALQVSASYGGSIDSNWLDGDTWGLNITLALKTTLWDGGKKLNDIRRSESGIESARIDYEAAIDTIESTVSSTYASAMLGKERIAFLEARMDADKLKAEMSVQREDIGYSSSSDTLQAQMAVIQDEIEIITERITLSQNAYTLMYLAAYDPGRIPTIYDGMEQ